MSKFDYKTIVIGGGAAGLTASIWSAKLGSKTLVVEKGNKLGGDCLHYGCVPSKSLIKSASVFHSMKKAGEYGLPAADIPPVDFAKIRGRIQNIISYIQEHDSPEFLKEHYGIDTQFGSPEFVDNHTIKLNGKTITAKNFILCTGSSPRIAPIEGIREVPFITNIDVFSLDRLPASLIVLGGGPIGVEMAQSFSRLGSKVTVIESGKCILPKDDPDISCYVHNLLEKEGIEFIIEAHARKAEKRERLIRLAVEQKGTMMSVEGECLLLATGRKPNVEGLSLEKAGIEYTPQGIKVNRRLQTTSRNIFACGDCHGGYLFTHIAEYDARIASLNAFLPLPLLKADYTNIPWCTYLDPEVASVGLTETSAKKSGIEYKVYKYNFVDVDRALTEGRTEGFVKILTDKKRRLLGAQIIGLHAGEVIHEWIAAINARIDIGKIEKAIHIYPTLSQINKKVSGSYLASQSSLVKIATYLFK